ncbi:hypothetical protein BH20VER3_BH20VER3_22350 [soil metagenome]
MTNGEARNNDEIRMTNSRDSNEAFWLEETALRLQEKAASSRVFDLEEWTARFGEAVIDFAKLIPRGPLTDRLIGQLVGCGTSVGGNYCEADDAVSRKEARMTKFERMVNGQARRRRRAAFFCHLGLESPASPRGCGAALRVIVSGFGFLDSSLFQVSSFLICHCFGLRPSDLVMSIPR